ncbi:hypothetical protein BHE74_00025053 [Ensete ventricosum]|nr:hypothetical protein BHE74_00025053 [Ensete ventricosum]
MLPLLAATVVVMGGNCFAGAVASAGSHCLCVRQPPLLRASCFCARQPPPLLVGDHTATAYARLLPACGRRLSAASARRRRSLLLSRGHDARLLLSRGHDARLLLSRGHDAWLLFAHDHRFAVILPQPTYCLRNHRSAAVLP